MAKVYNIETGKLSYETVDKTKFPKGPCPVCCNYCGGELALTEGGFICMDCGKFIDAERRLADELAAGRASGEEHGWVSQEQLSHNHPT